MREKEHSRHELVMPQSLHPLALRERGVCVCMRWHPGTYMDAHGHECVMESDVVRARGLQCVFCLDCRRRVREGESVGVFTHEKRHVRAQEVKKTQAELLRRAVVRAEMCSELQVPSACACACRCLL